MIDLAGLTPVGVRNSPTGVYLQWRTAERLLETDFGRFRPIRLFEIPESGALRAVWRDFADLPMTEPFFKETQDKAEALPSKPELFETDWDVVSRIAEQPGNIPLSGAIFHMARTGSTLIHRLLSKTGIVLNLSEIPVVDRALFVTTDWTEEERNPVLRGTVGVFGQPRRPSERHFVIKMTDAMPNTRLHQFRAAFPQVPWIFVYRDPVEVMVSMLRQPTGNVDNWFKNRARVAGRLGMPALASGAMWPEEFIGRTLRRFCMTAVEAARLTPPGLFLAVNYARLPDAVWETIAPHFGVTLSPTERQAMQAEARFSAKRTDRVDFQPDSRSKQEEAKPWVRSLAGRFVAPVIEQLKALPQA